VACTPRREPEPRGTTAATPSFYYWRTTLSLDAAERAALAELRIARLYLRLLDVTWDERAGVPRVAGELTSGDPLPAGLEVVPVVFLRQQVLRHLDAAAVRALAALLDERFASHLRTLGVTARELQLDCDWTDRTGPAFFSLLTELRRLAAARAPAGTPPPRLSATLRLHQIAHRERTGVPPVDRGMLMFYNMGRFSAEPEDRAIFDGARAAGYLARLADYPLPVDVALPIWAWTLHLRDGEVIDLLQSTDPAELEGVAFLRRTGQDRYVATETSFFRGALLREGDELKGERLSSAELAAAAGQLARALPAAPRAVALFDLSQRNLRRYDRSVLQRLFAPSVR
jgi:hypothetical protein